MQNADNGNSLGNYFINAAVAISGVVPGFADVEAAWAAWDGFPQSLTIGYFLGLFPDESDISLGLFPTPTAVGVGVNLGKV
jgi:hypothetical protein